MACSKALYTKDHTGTLNVPAGRMTRQQAEHIIMKYNILSRSRMNQLHANDLKKEVSTWEKENRLLQLPTELVNASVISSAAKDIIFIADAGVPYMK